MREKKKVERSLHHVVLERKLRISEVINYTHFKLFTRWLYK